jgi:hypothetical protein
MAAPRPISSTSLTSIEVIWRGRFLVAAAMSAFG